MGQTLGPGIVTDGLLVYWDFGNRKSFSSSTATIVHDISNNNIDGNLFYNSPVFDSNNLGSMTFYGLSGSVMQTINGNNLSTQNPLSFCAMVKRIIAVNSYNMFMGMGSLPYFCFRSDNTFMTSMIIGGSQQSLTTTPKTYLNNVWYYYCATYNNDGTGMKIYINGSLVAQNTVTGVSTYSSTKTCIGGRGQADFLSNKRTCCKHTLV